jgi:orotate phosphoribosyltransferase
MKVFSRTRYSFEGMDNSGVVKNAQTAASIAGLLLDLGAVRLRPDAPFTWASGWKSPIYCDNRLLLSSPEARRMVRDALAAQCQETFPWAACVAGVATAGIAHGLLVAEALDLPFVYVRAQAKAHGMGNRIEGKLAPGTPTLVVEDLVSTGGSSLQAVDALREAGAEVLGLSAIFTYGFAKANEAFAQASCSWFALCDYPHLVREAVSRGQISEPMQESLQAWRRDPASWQG